jgi:hypothetical protein
MREHDLRAASTFFESNQKSSTWRTPLNNHPYQIDHLLIPRSQLCHTTHLKRKLDCVDSDHAALHINFLLSIKTLLFNASDKNTIRNWEKTKIDNFLLHHNQKEKFQTSASNFLLKLDPKTATGSTNNEILSLIERHITKTTEEAAEVPVTSKPDWFSASENILMTLMLKQNEALKEFMKNGILETQNALKGNLKLPRIANRMTSMPNPKKHGE